jgi:glycosyltransferase involved in cell wall biosynthesis
MNLSDRTPSRATDLVCLSHLRWDFVYQRPNHLMSRAAAGRRVFFVEEPIRAGATPRIEAVARDGLTVVLPSVPDGMPESEAAEVLRRELDRFLASERVVEPWLWYYTPMALPWTDHVRAEAVIYDCMDELSGFKFCPPELRELERRLIARADVLFTGGRSLYEAKRGHHRNTFLFPSSVDIAHFAQARGSVAEPADQAVIGHPRIGYFGVIDERIDLDLLAHLAARRPEWQIVMVGPLAKITQDDLPQAANLHWLGLKSYAELPAYLAGWDVAIMPFALNDSTLHISPTKTPEYLSGGRPVVSTPIRDVVHPYGDEGLVFIADAGDGFVSAVEQALTCDRATLLASADKFLAAQSWDATWREMEGLVDQHKRARPVVLRTDLRTKTSGAPVPLLDRARLARNAAEAASNEAAKAAATAAASAAATVAAGAAATAAILEAAPHGSASAGGAVRYRPR